MIFSETDMVKQDAEITPAKATYAGVTSTGMEPRLNKKKKKESEWERVQRMRKENPEGLVSGGRRHSVPDEPAMRVQGDSRSRMDHLKGVPTHSRKIDPEDYCE